MLPVGAHPAGACAAGPCPAPNSVGASAIKLPSTITTLMGALMLEIRRSCLYTRPSAAARTFSGRRPELSHEDTKACLDLTSGASMWRPNNSQWWVLVSVAMLIVFVWPPSDDRS